MARDSHYDLHRLIQLVEQGCSPELAVRILGIPGDRFVDHGSVVDLRRVHRLDAPGLTAQVRETVAALGLEPSAIHASGVA